MKQCTLLQGIDRKGSETPFLGPESWQENSMGLGDQPQKPCDAGELTLCRYSGEEPAAKGRLALALRQAWGGDVIQLCKPVTLKASCWYG